jgi:sugar phosphate isomerase/epimerase
MDRVAAAGYDAIEFNAEDIPWAPAHVTPALTSEQRTRLRRRARDAGIAISAIGGHISLVEADPDQRQANLDYALGCIDLAADVGAEVDHIFSGMAPEGVPFQEAWAWLVDGAARCIERGQSRGITVGFEPVATQFVCTVEGLRRLMNELEPLSLYANYDPSHYLVHGDDPVASVRTFGDRIAHVHVKDAKGVPEAYEFPPLGQGAIDFPGMISALRETDYSGFLSVEYEANAFGYVETEGDILAHGIRFVRALLA